VPAYQFQHFYLAFSHLENGKFLKAKMVRRKCQAVMLIFVPVDTSIHQAVVFLRGPHNHPMHPKTKPSSEDKLQLEKAIQAAGTRRLTVQKLLNGTSESRGHGYNSSNNIIFNY
jgi:hypothetical protein